MIYADNAATTQPCEAALTAMLSVLQNQYGNPSSLHSLGQEASALLERARRNMANCLHCSPRELTFTSGGSEGANQVIRSAAQWGRKNGKTHILSTAFEHHAVLHTLEALEREGFAITLLQPNEKHNITAEQVEAALRPDTCLVSAMFANNEIGSVLPIAELGALCRRRGVLLHTDAVQAVGHIPVDVQALQVDYLTLSAHKFHGPKGIGALYCRRGAPLSPLLLGGAQERGQRAGTENLPAIAGMAAALEESCRNMEENLRHVTSLRTRLETGLRLLPGVTLNGDPTHRHPGIVNAVMEGLSSEALVLLLDQRGICASAGAACAAGSLEPSHVLLALGYSRQAAGGGVRLSLGAGNTEEEVEEILSALSAVVERLRRMQEY